jgi:hypothetical protein
MRLLKEAESGAVSRRRVLILAPAACLPGIPARAQERSRVPVD